MVKYDAMQMSTHMLAYWIYFNGHLAFSSYVHYTMNKSSLLGQYYPYVSNLADVLVQSDLQEQ